MGLATSMVTLFVYIVIPTIFAATTYSRSVLDIAEMNEQSLLNIGWEFREIQTPPTHANPNEQSTMGAEREFIQGYPPNPAKPKAQSLSRVGRMLSEIDFPTDLGVDYNSPISVPVSQRLIPRNQNFRRIPAVNISKKPFQTVPVRGGRQGSSKGTQHIPDLENGLIFDDRTPLSTSSNRLRPRPRLPAQPYEDDNGLRR